MTTQKRKLSNVLASALVGALIAGLLGAGLFVINGGSFDEVIQGDTHSRQASTVELQKVTDSLGREVEIPANPQRIAAMDAFSGNVCVLLGAGDKMMGAPGGVISNELLQELSPTLDSITQLAGNVVNTETLLAEGVDVVLIRKALFDSEKEVEQLDKLDIPYVVVDYKSIEEQIDAIKLLGKVCGESSLKTADLITQYYQQTLDMVEKRAELIPENERKRVYHSINDPFLCDGSDSIGADWILRCGAISVSGEEESTEGMGDYNATLEQIYEWAPDAIICSTAAAKQTILSDPQWQGLDALASQQVYNLPVSSSRWGQRGDPEVFLGMLWLGKTLYPDVYEDIDLKETVVSYYKDIIGLTIDDETWDAIVAGEGLRIESSGGQEGGRNA